MLTLINISSLTFGTFLGTCPAWDKILSRKVGTNCGTKGVTPYRAYPMSRRMSTHKFSILLTSERIKNDKQSETNRINKA